MAPFYGFFPLVFFHIPLNESQVFSFSKGKRKYVLGWVDGCISYYCKFSRGSNFIFFLICCYIHFKCNCYEEILIPLIFLIFIYMLLVWYIFLIMNTVVCASNDLLSISGFCRMFDIFSYT